MITIKQLRAILDNCEQDDAYLTIWCGGERYVVNDIDESFINDGFLEFNVSTDEVAP